MKPILLLAASLLSLAAQPAYVYAVHGIPGDNGLPVDISVDGACVVTGFTFGNVGGPLSLPAGTYNVGIHLANSLTPCGNAAVLTASPTLAAGNSYALVAHLTEAAGLKLSGFALDLSKTAPGSGRFILHHTAAAPAVDVNVFRGDGNGRAPSVPVPGFKNGDQVPAEFRAGEWNATLSVGGQTVFGPTALVLKPKTAKLVFAVGVFPDSFTYIVKDIAIN
jgi:hypothetical protein